MRLYRVALFALLFVTFACEKGAQCKNEEDCLNNPKCQCWCSVKCGFRDKHEDDHPLYISDDPHRKYCYCKQWDFNYFEDNCILHQKIPEPSGAQ